MNIDYTVTALMFPAIPLLMSVYSNRFHTLSKLIRELHDEHVYEKHIPPEWKKQFMNLSSRITIIRWTIMFAAFGFLFNMLTVFALYLDEVFLNKTMEKIRKEQICKKQIKKGRSGTRQIIECLKKGSSIALMIDQRVREGSKIKFFGNLATTTTIPAQLIKKYKCELVPIYIERYNNYYFKMHVSKPISVGSKKSVEDISSFLNKVLEKMIIKNPDQWIWTHDRWKK